MKRTGLAVLFLFFLGRVVAQELYHIPDGMTSHVSSMENLNGLKAKGGQSNGGAKGSAFTSLTAGETKTLLVVNGPGIIQRIWMTFDDRSPEMLTGLLLKIYWDNSSVPAVDVPVGNFFCAGEKPVAFESALFSDPEGRSFNCAVQMPFRKGARVTLTNSTAKDLSLLFFDIDFVKQVKPDAAALYFHSTFSHEHKPPGQDVDLTAKIRGKGRFLGVYAVVTVDPAYGHTWWGEGEVKMFIDGDSRYPTINGTGAEDYIGTGWFEGPFAHRYEGCLEADAALGKYAFYRFHVPDAIYFQKDFKATIQQIGGWYAKDVKALQAKGVPLIPVSLYGDKGFRGIYGKRDTTELANAAPQDWLNFYRSDDYAVTAYYYVNHP